MPYEYHPPQPHLAIKITDCGGDRMEFEAVESLFRR